MILIAFLFFSVSLFEKSYSSVSGVDRHLEYLSDKGIIDQAQLSFIRNNAISKNDMIYYLYKILETVDEKKANREDLEILENLVAEIFIGFDLFKKNNIEREKFEAQYEITIGEIYSILEEKKKSIESLSTRLIELEERVNLNIDYEKNALRRFIKNNSLDLKAIFLFNIFSNSKSQSFYGVRSSLSNKYFDLRALINSYTYLLELDIPFSDRVSMELHSGDAHIAFLTASRILLTTEYKEKRTFVSFNFGTDYNKELFTLHLISSEDAHSFLFVSRNSLFNIDLMLSSNVTELSGVFDNIYINYLELSHLVPFSDSLEVLFGTFYKDSYLEGFGFASYRIDNAHLFFRVAAKLPKLSYKLYAAIKYMLFEDSYIGASINWFLGSSENNIEDWKLVLTASVSDNIDISSIAGFNREFFLSFNGHYISDSLEGNLGIYLENIKDGDVGFVLFTHLEVPLMDTNINFVARYTYSNIDFNNDIYGFDAEHFSLLPNIGSLSKDTSLFYIGLSLVL